MFKKTRLHVRKTLAQFGFIQILGDDGGQILNISDSGLCFQTFAPIGNVRNLHFWFSLNMRDRVDATGQVAWLDAETRIGGLRFLNLTERALKHIRAYSAGTREEKTCEKGRFFAAALAKQSFRRASVESDIPRSEVPFSSNMRAAQAQPLRLLEDLSRGNVLSSSGMESTDLISLQRHRVACRRHMILGFFLGVLLSSVAGTSLVLYFGPRTASVRSQTAIVGSSQATTKQETAPAPSGPSTATPTAVNVSAPAKPQQSLGGNSYSDRQPKRGQLQSASPFSEESGGHGAVSKPNLPRDGSASVKSSHATPQQLWSAVQAGDSNAAVVLADRYLRGDGVPLNCLQARVLLLVASEKNNATATKKLHELDKTGCS